MTSLLVALGAPALVAWAAIAILARSARLRTLLSDHPNERSLHSLPTPRLGGLGLLAGAIPVAAAFAAGPVAAILALALAVAFVSFLDDIRSLPVEVRLPAHLVAAGLAVLAMQSTAAAWGWLAAIAATFAIAWMANLFNFMDGADGLAGGMAAIGFGTMAWAAAGAGHGPLSLACAAIASASIGFLLHNFPPARVFLGDSGSVTLGFLAGALGAVGVASGAWPAWFPLLVFSPFIVDASVTLARRLLRGEKVWRAHREHGYQRLVLRGWSKRRLALGAFALMAAAAASALAALRSEPMVRCGIIFAWAMLYALLVVAIDRAAPRQGASS